MEMLAPHSVKGIRLDSHLYVQYGEREITTAKHRCICRACGQPILKGGQRYTFFHDFTGAIPGQRLSPTFIWQTAPGFCQSKEAMENLTQEENQ
jgi:hypothetical protein